MEPFRKERPREPDRFQMVEELDRSSKAIEVREPTDWEDHTGLFAALMSCSKCKEVIALCGSFTTELGGEDGISPYSEFKPHYFSPAPPILHIPENAPASMSRELKDAFALFWADHRSCLNKLRSATEALLTHLGVKRFGMKKAKAPATKGERVPLSLASRIEILTNKNKKHSSELTALRQLGNVGSHGGEITASDALDGFELMMRLLDAIFVRSDDAFTKMVKEIVKRQGPRRIKLKKKRKK